MIDPRARVAWRLDTICDLQDAIGEGAEDGPLSARLGDLSDDALRALRLHLVGEPDVTVVGFGGIPSATLVEQRAATRLAGFYRLLDSGVPLEWAIAYLDNTTPGGTA